MKAILSVLSLSVLALNALPQPSVLHYSFDTSAEQRQFSKSPAASWVKDKHGSCLKITGERRDAANTIQTVADLSKCAGREIIVKCRIRAVDISRPQKSYNGIKLMLHYETPSTGKQWPGARIPQGTFEWQSFNYKTTLPRDIGEVAIVLGLQDSTGTVMFDNLEIKLSRHQVIKHPPPMKHPPPVFKGHPLPRLRGAMSGSREISEEDIRNFAEDWGGNLIRFQINRNWHKANDNRDLAEYNRWVDSRLDKLEEVLGYCAKYGVCIAVDLHALPGGRYENRSMAMFYEKPYAEEFVRIWQKIARRFKGNGFIWAYDLVNEPVHAMEIPEEMDDFRGLQIKAARAIRAIDPEKPIIFEVCKWDSPEGFNYMIPVDMPKIIYQAHMYRPHAYTHQGLHDDQVFTYPGEISGRLENRETLKEYLKPVRDFQLAYNVHIYIGEFSAARWAPGAQTYLNDVISIFEEYDWDWSYHAYREAQCWSLEHTEEKGKVEPAKEPTARLKVIKTWFGKNHRAQ